MNALRYILLTSVATLLCQAQNVQPLVHALELKHLAEEREGECKLSEARSLYLATGKSLKAMPEDALTGAGAGVNQAVIDDRLTKLNERQKAIANDSRKAADVLKRGQAETALELWRGYGGPTCDPELGATLQQTRSRALELVSQGDAEVDARRRLQIYLDAFHLNSQIPGLYGKLSRTRHEVDQLPCNACRVAGKTVKIVVIVAGLAAGAYFGYREYQKYEKAHSTACVAGVVCQ